MVATTATPDSVTRGGASKAHTSALVGTWVFVLSDAVGFVALLSTVAALRAGSVGFADSGPSEISVGLGVVATLLLGLLSLSLILARRMKAGKLAMAVAFVCSLAFCALQVHEYQTLFGPDFPRPAPPLQSFLVVTGYHLLHVVGGSLALLWALTKKPEKAGTRFGAPSVLAPLSIYWHFVDGLWVAIFVFFYLM
jgi:cytochrome c oxidase subunit 3